MFLRERRTLDSTLADVLTFNLRHICGQEYTHADSEGAITLAGQLVLSHHFGWGGRGLTVSLLMQHQKDPSGEEDIWLTIFLHAWCLVLLDFFGWHFCIFLRYPGSFWSAYTFCLLTTHNFAFAFALNLDLDMIG